MRLPGKFRLLFLSIVGGVLLAASGWAQDASVPEEASEDAEKEAAESPAQEPDTDDIDVDDGSYLDADEDDFRPSEEIPADQSIPFPADI